MTARTASLVVEWDNVRFSEVRRGYRILERLAGQIRDQQREPDAASVKDFLVLYNAEELDGAPLRAVAEGLGHDGVPVQVIATRGLGYYQLKNEGARRSGGDVVVFADSDAVPEDGWLARILAPFADPAVAVVAGNSYVEPTGLWGKAFGLAWYFPARVEDDNRLTVTDKFLANNVAFRRDVFEAFPFPEDRERYRSQCVTLAETLRAHGVTMHLCTAARAAHPAPRGVAGLVRSALCNGHDAVLRARAHGEGGSGLRAAYWDLRGNLRRSFSNVVHHRERVGLSRLGVPAALAVACAYHGLWCLGEVATRFRPALVRRLYRL